MTNPAVADAVVVTPREVLVDGKGPGTTSLIIWGAGGRVQYDVAVDPGVATLEQHFKALFPGEDIRVSVSDEAVILAGEVSSNNVVLRAGEIATGAYAKSQVINMLGSAGRHAEPAGDAAGALRRGEPARPHRTGGDLRLDRPRRRPHHDAAVLRRRTSTTQPARRAHVLATSSTCSSSTVRKASAC